MSKKLMLLAAGALTALAFAALPAVSSAGELEAHCEGAAVCTGTITSGGPEPIFYELENTAGERVRCTGLTGTTEFTSTTKTGTATLDFTGCREQSIFKFKCNTVGKPAETIIVENLTYHLVNLESAGSPTPGIAFTGVNVTFECAGAFKKTVTGTVLGHIENAACNANQSTTNVNFEAGTTTGTQKYTQITTSGTVLDLISKNHPEGTYSTSSQAGTGIIHWSNPVKITC